MKLTVWQGYEQGGKRRFAASSKPELLKAIAERCPDVRIVREFHVWKSTVSIKSAWVHGVISALGNEDISGEKLLGREYVVPVEDSRSKCYFALKKCIQDVPDKSVRPGTTSETSA